MCGAEDTGSEWQPVNYGDAAPTPEALEDACPIVASYGARDPGNENVPAKLEYHLTRLGVEHDVKQYPNAGHSFLTTPTSVRGSWQPLVPAGDVGPEPESAADAWQRIDAFFGTHLPR